MRRLLAIVIVGILSLGATTFHSDQRLIYEEPSHLAVQISTNTTVQSGAAGTLHQILVQTAGTTSTVEVWDDASAPCSENQLVILPTTTAGEVYDLDIPLVNGGCVVTTGGAAATIWIQYHVK
jgi:hypothetical protein